jgi:hypothetical protein
MALDPAGTRLLALSTRMLKAAENGDWDEVARLDAERRRLATRPGVMAQLPEAVRLGEKVRALAENKKSEVARQLEGLRRGRRAAAAYDSEK